MIIPEIMPGELALGYFFRFRDINAYQKDITAINALKVRFGIKGEQSNPLALLLARALGMTLQQFCRFHTLIPFARAVVDYLPELPHGDASELRPIICHGLGLSKKIDESIKVCECCVAEDVDYWGYAYYRREHQLTGVSFCSKHKKLLLESSRSLRLNLDNIKPIANLNYSEINDNKFDTKIINRYFTIVEAWSMSERPIPVLNIVSVLQTQARSLGLRWWKSGNKLLLSDLVLQVCPEWWVETIIPNILSKRKNQPLSRLDGVLVQQERTFKSSSYALALSVLYENADDALNASYACIKNKPRMITKTPKIGNAFYEGKQLTEKFIYHKGNVRGIANELGVDSFNLRSMMKKKGLPSLYGYSQKELQAFQDFQNGMSLSEVGNKYGVSLERIEELLRSSSKKLAEAIILLSKIKEELPRENKNIIIKQSIIKTLV